jgi:hypothetical protein
MDTVSYRPHVVYLYDLSSDDIMKIAQWIISCEMGHVSISNYFDDDITFAMKYRYAFDRPEDAAFFKLKWT